MLVVVLWYSDMAVLVESGDDSGGDMSTGQSWLAKKIK